jgi:anaerobic magnesium-protoporphyrin IX monomethyl ester cyclase
LDHLERGVPLMDRGVYIKGNFLPSEMLFYLESDLDRIPIIDRTLLPLENYTSVLSSRPQITTMITSRGCPHKCVYCKLSFQKPVSHSAQHVVAEMKEIVQLGFREVEIYDDTFTWSKPRLMEICERLIADKVPLEWAVRDRVSNTDEKTLNLMKRAGCRRIHLGIESGNPIILKRIKKGITLEQARQAVELAKQAGLKVLTYFMIGLPGETRQEVKDTIDFALSLDSDYAEFNVTIPYPGTEMYQEALTEKIIPVDYWRNYALNPIPDFKIPHFYEEHLAIQEMVQLTNLATRRFYFRPRLLWRELASCLNVAEFRKKAAMGLNLLKQSLPSLGSKSSYKN